MNARPKTPRPSATRRGRTARPRLRILITAGPTREYFDSVRFISNPSSGKMGYALARAAASRGHRVTLVSGPVALKPPRLKRIKTIRVTTAAEMAAAAKKAFKTADAAILTAAVCDYRPRRRARLKVPKTGRPMVLDLIPTEDIAAALGRRKGRRITIAFALEDHDGRPKAERKMVVKKSDAIVLNGPQNVGSDRAQVGVLARGRRWKPWPAASKSTVAARLVALLEQLVQAAKPPARRFDRTRPRGRRGADSQSWPRRRPSPRSVKKR